MFEQLLDYAGQLKDYPFGLFSREKTGSMKHLRTLKGRERKLSAKPNKSLNFGFLEKMFLKFSFLYFSRKKNVKVSP